MSRLVAPRRFVLRRPPLLVGRFILTLEPVLVGVPIAVVYRPVVEFAIGPARSNLTARVADGVQST